MTPPRVQVTMHAGRLVVRGDPDVAEPTVSRAAAKSDTDPGAVEAAANLRVETTGEGLVLVVPDPPRRGRTPQLVVELLVPPDTDVLADAGEAQVVATGALGSLVARTSSGSVAAERVTGPVDVRTGRGPVTLHDCDSGGTIDVSDGVVILRAARGPLHVRSRSGDVHVWWTCAPAAVATATGNVRIGWADDRPVRLSVHTDTGRRAVTVPDDPDAPDLVEVRTVTGDVSISPATSWRTTAPRGPWAVVQDVRRLARRWRPD